MAYQIDDVVKYATGNAANPKIVEAKIFAKFGNKVSLDHSSFSRARSVSVDSPRLMGKA